MRTGSGGDLGPLIAGLLFFVVGIIATFNLFGLTRRLAQRVSARYANGSARMEALAFATYRAAGVLSLFIAVYFWFIL